MISLKPSSVYPGITSDDCEVARLLSQASSLRVSRKSWRDDKNLVIRLGCVIHQKPLADSGGLTLSTAANQSHEWVKGMHILRHFAVSIRQLVVLDIYLRDREAFRLHFYYISTYNNGCRQGKGRVD
jgi:hypothetical protein